MKSVIRTVLLALVSVFVVVAVAQDDEDIASMPGHKAEEEGAKLFKAKEYAAAVPYLQLASEWGFKNAQNRLGQIYFKGLGSVEKNRLRGLAWLGTAASKPSNEGHIGLYERSLAKVGEEHHAAVERAVSSFTQRYGSGEAAVTCRMKAPLGSNLAQLTCDYDADYEYSPAATPAWDEHAGSAF